MSASIQGQIEDIEKLIIKYRRRLQKLQEQQAQLGLNTPLEILNEIEDIEKTIEELGQELKSLEQKQPEVLRFEKTQQPEALQKKLTKQDLSQNIKTLIDNHKRRLQRLQEKKALFGDTISASVLIEIEDTEVAIEKLEQELANLKEPRFEEAQRSEVLLKELAHPDSTRNLISAHKRRLQKLREQQARLGLTTSPAILHEIEETEAAIEKLEQELASLEQYQPESKDLQTKQRIQINLTGEFPAISNDRKQAALDAFAAILGVSPNDIVINEVYEG
jgi:hypothetical protein